jgi:hemoglobin/transferrin/lactoferrin receptor protein
LFVQDEISVAGGQWELIPALRWDDYQLDPKPDELWLEDFPDMEVASVSENDFTPRLGVVYHPGDVWSVYGQYASGFRAPPFEDANIGLDLPLFGYRAIPNPDLKSETSDGFELGTRRITSSSRFSLALFDTEYDDFIESRTPIGIDEVTGDLIFQSINAGKARIYGMDLGLDQDLGAWSDGLQGLTLRASAFWAKGRNRQTDEPLNSIAPPQAVLGLSWVSPAGDWELGLTSTLTAAKHSDDIDEVVVPRFATPSWITVDFTTAWQCTSWLELRAGVFNIGNETYWRWLDVARLDASDPMIPILSRPGRNYSFTARFSY